jgi:hypothetical protein
MDYQNIVLFGYINPTTKDHFKSYLLREFEKAKKENYSADEFFKGCIKATKSLNTENFDRFYKRVNELHILKDMAKNGGLSYDDLKGGQTKEEYEKEMIDYCDKELERKEPFGYCVPLLMVTNGKFSGHLSYENILDIEKNIREVWKEVNTPVEEILNTSNSEDKYYSKFFIHESELKHKSILETKVILTNIFENYDINDQRLFLDWFEYSYLTKIETFAYAEKTRHKDVTSPLIVASIQMKQQKINFIKKWIDDKRLLLKTVNNVIEKKINLNPDKEKNAFNPNHFNDECYGLFCYLIDNYSKKGKIKYVNIYYFLKDDVNKEKYSFKYIQKDYTQFIKSKYNIEIKKYQKAMFDYDEQKRILNSLEEQFRKQ